MQLMVLILALAFASWSCTHTKSTAASNSQAALTKSHKSRAKTRPKTAQNSEKRTVGLQPSNIALDEQTYSTSEFSIASDLGVPAGVCKLGTTLLLPESASAQEPAKLLVLIIHGSGPTDRDGTVGNYKPYRDIAHGLAAAGLAVARFDKRATIKSCATKLRAQHGPDDMIKDIAAVAKALAKRPELRGTPLILLGHSEGVTMALEIAARQQLVKARPPSTRADVQPLRGLVLMAGLGRYPIDATLLRQLHEAAKTEGIDPDRRAELESLIKTSEAYLFTVRDGSAKPDDNLLGAYTKFWREMIALTDRSAATAASLKLPTLVLQGDADRNVTIEDFNALKDAIGNPASDPHSGSTLFPGLNHLFAPAKATRVDPRVISRMITWLIPLADQPHEKGP